MRGLCLTNCFKRQTSRKHVPDEIDTQRGQQHVGGIKRLVAHWPACCILYERRYLG
jgi:hypothetical protein